MNQQQANNKSLQNPMNHHCCVVEVDNTGIIIEGESGGGKTSLALGLVEKFSSIGKPAFLISDDQIFLEILDGNLVCRTPSTIAGKAELHGFGVIDFPYKAFCKAGLLVRLIDDHLIERMPEKQAKTLHNIKLPYLQLPQRHEEQSIRIIKAWFEKYK